MNRTPVDSSNIASVGFQANPGKTEGTLEVEFRNGAKVYQYEGVPQETYDSMMASGSVGKFFTQNIRNTYTGVPV